MKMARTFTILAVACVLFTTTRLAAENAIDVDVRKSFARLSDVYARQYPAGTVRKGLAVLPFEENYEYTGFLAEQKSPSDHELEMKEKYLGMPLSILADGHDVNDLSFNRSYAMGISLNFYF